MKQCSKCDELKEINNFRKFFDKRDGKFYYRSSCKKCENKIGSEYHKKHPECSHKSYFKTGKKKRQKRFAELKRKYGLGWGTLQLYGIGNVLTVWKRDGGKCTRCGNNKKLSIHHKDKNGLYSVQIGKIKKMNNNPENLELICRHCHNGFHSKEYWRNFRKLRENSSKGIVIIQLKLLKS